jgi:hypothetical protein
MSHKDTFFEWNTIGFALALAVEFEEVGYFLLVFIGLIMGIPALIGATRLSKEDLSPAIAESPVRQTVDVFLATAVEVSFDFRVTEDSCRKFSESFLRAGFFKFGIKNLFALSM